MKICWDFQLLRRQSLGALAIKTGLILPRLETYPEVDDHGVSEQKIEENLSIREGIIVERAQVYSCHR